MSCPGADPGVRPGAGRGAEPGLGPDRLRQRYGDVDNDGRPRFPWTLVDDRTKDWRLSHLSIWYLNHYAQQPRYSSSGRPSFLARELNRIGHDVTVVAASYHHLRDESVGSQDVDRPLDSDAGRFIYLPTRTYRGNGARRYLNMMDYVRGIGRLGHEIDAGRLTAPDVIIASSAHIFVYPPARRLATRLGIPVIFEVRDLWPLSLVEIAGVHPWHPMIAIMAHIERNAYRTANAVVSLLPNALEHMTPRGLTQDRFRWIPNGVLASEWDRTPEPLPDEHRHAIEECRRRDKLVVVYAGSHGPPNALEHILRLAEIPAGDHPYHFILIGDGISRPALIAEAGRRGVDFVTFLPRVSRMAARSAILASDACYIGWQERPLYRFGVSANKLFEYMMAGKPVVHAIGGHDDPVERAAAGFRVSPSDPRELDAALRALAGMQPSERSEMGARGRDHVLRHHEWSVLARRYADLCEEITGRRAARSARPAPGSDDREPGSAGGETISAPRAIRESVET